MNSRFPAESVALHHEPLVLVGAPPPKRSSRTAYVTKQSDAYPLRKQAAHEALQLQSEQHLTNRQARLRVVSDTRYRGLIKPSTLYSDMKQLQGDEHETDEDDECDEPDPPALTVSPSNTDATTISPPTASASTDTATTSQTTPAPPSHRLSDTEMQALREWVVVSDSHLQSTTKRFVLTIAKWLLETRGSKWRTDSGLPPDSWWKTFRKSFNGEIQFKRSARVDVAKAVAERDGESIERFYEYLRVVAQRYQIPWSRVYNADETDLVPEDATSKERWTLTRRDNNRGYRREAGSQGHCTLLACASACGVLLPPFYIFDGSTISTSLVDKLEQQLTGACPHGACAVNTRKLCIVTVIRSSYRTWECSERSVGRIASGRM
jgi:hypothetical protein